MKINYSNFQEIQNWEMDRKTFMIKMKITQLEICLEII